MSYSILASVLFAAAILLLFDLTPEQVTGDILAVLSPKDSLRTRSRALRGNKKTHRLYHALIRFREALAATGKSGQFTVVCFTALFLFGGGLALAVLIGNLFLAPVVAVTFGLMPFLYSSSSRLIRATSPMVCMPCLSSRREMPFPIRQKAVSGR